MMHEAWDAIWIQSVPDSWIVAKRIAYMSAPPRPDAAVADRPSIWLVAINVYQVDVDAKSKWDL